LRWFEEWINISICLWLLHLLIYPKGGITNESYFPILYSITILDDLEKYGHVLSDSPLSTASVKESLQYNYSRYAEPMLDEIVKGTFLSEDHALNVGES
jgi:hypothetical protein